MLSREEELSRIGVKKQRSTQHNTRPKGFGTIDKREDRKNKYRVRIPVGRTTTKSGKERTIYKTLGSYPTKKLAEAVLDKYNAAPYNLNSKIKTFKQLYEAWLEDYLKKYPGDSVKRSLRSTFAYCHEFWDMDIHDITVGTIKDMMEQAYVIIPNGKNAGQIKHASKSTQERIKSMCNLMFDYALERNLVISNEARKFHVGKLLQDIDREAKKKIPFSEDDVQKMWEEVDHIDGLDMVLIGIYTGFRPRELCQIKTDNVHLEENYIIGGMKTEAGTDRVVPIHPKIHPLVSRRYMLATDCLHTEFLFPISKGTAFCNISYESYRRIFGDIMAELQLSGFTPHCTRHTFATQAEICQLRELAIKKILGHSVRSDVTMKHYQHIDLTYLYGEICKLSFGGVS